MNTEQVTPYPRLEALVQAAAARAQARPRALGLVYPCDALAMDAAERIRRKGLFKPVLIGPGLAMERAAQEAEVDLSAFERLDTDSSEADAPAAAAQLACQGVRSGKLHALMKGSLHTDELMSAVVNKTTGLRTATRMSHAFVFDLPRYHKLLALADCVVNIAPDARTKEDILSNALGLLAKLGIGEAKVGIVTAVEMVNPAIPATLDARALVERARAGAWPGAIVEGPLGFDNAMSAQAARIKKITSHVAGDADLLLVPDLNAGNLLYKSFNYIGGGECAGLVLGAQVPIVLTSRADSLTSRLASVALAVLAAD